MAQIDLRFYIWLFFRRAPYIILLALVGAIAGVLVALSLPPTYRAVATLLVESPRISSDLARSTVPTDVIEQLQILEQRLTTRDSLLSMARMYQVYSHISELSESDVAADMRDRTRLDPQVFGSPRGGSGAMLFSVSFDAGSPVLAADVANGFATRILEGNAKQRQDRAADALEFIRQDVEHLATALSNAEAAVAAFTSAHQHALPDSLEFRRANQVNQEQRLLQIQRELESLRKRRISLVQIYSQASGAPTSGFSGPEDEIIAGLRRKLAEQRAIFAEGSANIMALRERIAALEGELRAKRSGEANESGTSTMPAELSLRLVDIDNQIQFLNSERSALEASLARLEEAISATIDNTPVLHRLQRNYESALSRYNDAQARLMEASTGARIEQQSIGEKLTLMEPALPPEKALGSKRRYIAAGGGLAGFALGVALVLAFEFWRGAIYRPSDIARVYNGEPLAAIPFIHAPASLRKPKLPATIRRTVSAFFVGFALLIAVGHVQFSDGVSTLGHLISASLKVVGSG